MREREDCGAPTWDRPPDERLADHVCGGGETGCETRLLRRCGTSAGSQGSCARRRKFCSRHQILGGEALLVLPRYAPGKTLLMQQALNRRPLERLCLLRETGDNLSGRHSGLRRERRGHATGRPLAAGSRAPRSRKPGGREQIFGRKASLVLARHAPGKTLLMQETLNWRSLERL